MTAGARAGNDADAGGDADADADADAARAANAVGDVPYLSASEPRLWPCASKLLRFRWADSPPSGVLGGVDAGGGGGGESRDGARARTTARAGPREAACAPNCAAPAAADCC